MSMLLIPMLAGGCFNTDEGDVYLLQVPRAEGGACEATIDENHQEGAPPAGTGGGDSEWTETESGTFSDEMFFVEVVDLKDGSAVLVLDGGIYPGTLDGGVHTFTWETFADGTQKVEHETGYLYEIVDEGSKTTTITFERAKDGITGTMSTVEDTTRTIRESDEWTAEDLGFMTGQIPFGTYLELEDTSPARNRGDTDDCSGETCQLTLGQSCDSAVDFTGTRVKIDDEAYESIQGAGQPGGWN